MLAGLACGATVRAVSPWVTGVREPFDSETLYYPIAIFSAGVIASGFGPRHWWLSIPAVFLGEHLYALVAYPDLRPWFLFGLLVNFVIPTWWPAALGALLVFITHRLFAGPASGRGRSNAPPG